VKNGVNFKFECDRFVEFIFKHLITYVTQLTALYVIKSFISFYNEQFSQRLPKKYKDYESQTL
jgi:hypothetical protein